MRGFTIFFGVLVASLALAIGIAIYDITVRQLELSGTLAQSQLAIYAADTGAECALYWDSKCTLSGCAFGSIFATSSTSVPPTTGMKCNAQDVTPPLASIVGTATAATSTFQMYVSAPSGVSATTTCAKIQVGKSVTASGVIYTNIVSSGYNNCIVGSDNRLERVLQLNY